MAKKMTRDFFFGSAAATKASLFQFLLFHLQQKFSHIKERFTLNNKYVIRFYWLCIFQKCISTLFVLIQVGNISYYKKSSATVEASGMSVILLVAFPNAGEAIGKLATKEVSAV